MRVKVVIDTIPIMDVANLTQAEANRLVTEWSDTLNDAPYLPDDCQLNIEVNCEVQDVR